MISLIKWYHVLYVIHTYIHIYIYVSVHMHSVGHPRQLLKSIWLFLPPEGLWPPVPFHIPPRPARSRGNDTSRTIRMAEQTHETLENAYSTMNKHENSSRHLTIPVFLQHMDLWMDSINYAFLFGRPFGVLLNPPWSTRDGIMWFWGTAPAIWALWMNSISVLWFFALWDGIGILLRQSF